MTPQAYCPGTKIHLDWNAAGDTYLKISPPDQQFMPVDSAGEKELAPSAMTIDIQALRNNRRDAHEVTVAPAASRPFVGDALDCDARLAKTRPIEIRPGDYDPRALLQSISSSCHDKPDDPCPTITVCRGPNPDDPCSGVGARAWEVAPDHPAVVSHDAAGMAGYWVLARRLAPGERCGSEVSASGRGTRSTTSQKMTHLKVQFTLSCAPQGATP
ncbi:MAG TPA: hypothetical protein VFT22_28925 [Kofleriaceae bacterium]|nr:hypothetical protein [Kofleriaceae bacterium]